MHERFLLHFGIKLMKVADHSERKKKKMNKTFRCSKLKRTSWPNAEENFVFVTNFKYVKLILIFVLKQGDPCKCYIYISDDNCAHLYNRRELYTISVAWLRLEAFGLIIRSLERKRQQWWFLLWCPVPEQTSNFHSHATLTWQASHKELMAYYRRNSRLVWLVQKVA